MNNISNNNLTHFQYINSSSPFALIEFNTTLFSLLSKYTSYYSDLIFLCVGTDKATGDSLGPLIGYKLSKLPLHKKISIYGTLENPIHAKNLLSSINNIYLKHNNPLIVAIDASLGKENFVNYINIGEGSIKPGAGIKKDLPYIGDIFITGIVNNNSILEVSTLQSTRLFNVMRMADIISSGIWHCTSSIL